MFTKATVVAVTIRQEATSILMTRDVIMERRDAANRLEHLELTPEELVFIETLIPMMRQNYPKMGRPKGASVTWEWNVYGPTAFMPEKVDADDFDNSALDVADETMMESDETTAELPVVPQLPGPEEEPDAGTGAPPPKNTPLMRDLLEMFVQEGCRMSGGEAYLWLREHGKRYAEGTVKQTLCRMRRDALLNNVEDNRGDGYGLSEWA